MLGSHLLLLTPVYQLVYLLIKGNNNTRKKMKLSQSIIKQVLIDAEKTFSQKPIEKKFNIYGLCFFIIQYLLINGVDFNLIRKYQKEILGDKFGIYYAFCWYDNINHSQQDCWNCKELHHLRFERRDWCRAELKRRFNITKH